jgi:lysophospholipase L1-like esterase
MVLGWGGKMYFIYLPTFVKYSTDHELKNNDFIMQTATELDIPIIDIHKEVFDPHPDPLSLFASLIITRLHHHYTAEGYRLVAEAIGKRLEADGYVPIKSKE